MKRFFAAVIATAMLTAIAAYAQDESPPTPPDHPSLREIMTLQQLRHIKLWFAGQAGNWPLADYEIDGLEEGFEDVSKLLGPDIVDVATPIKALEKAITDKDRTAFEAAFDRLSAACNECHHTLDHGFIAIQRPTLLPYSDQSFAPQK